MIQVRKRDGSLVPFDLSKIKNAILKDLKAIHHEGNIDDIATHYANRVDGLCREKYLGKSEIFDIENIQDTVVQVLASEGEVRAVIAYCEYRYQHKLEREHRIKKTYEDKLMAKNVVNQNANIDEYSGGGRSGEAANVYEKQYALEHCMSKLARTNHENNEVYIHDLNKYAIGFHNCLSIPFDDLLSKGFHTRQGDVRPAGSLNTAMQLVAVIFQLQSLNQFGGVSATHLDWTMVPYFRKSFMKHYIVAWAKSQDSFGDTDFIKLYDETYTDAVGVIRSVFDEWCDKNKDSFFAATGLTKDDFTLANKKKLDNKLYNSALCDTLQELRQAVEAMYHNLNTLQSRSGDQLPFTSINYGTCTFEEGRLVTRALLLGSLEGIGFHHNTPIFPCGIFQYMKGVNDREGTPNYDLKQLAMKSTSQRLYPNYANVDWSGNEGYDRNDPRTYFSTMGCRTANGFDINGFGQLKDGRGNICPTTIIMPTLAMEAGGDVEKFMTLLDQKIHEAKDTLIERFNWICSQDPRSTPFMWDNNTMAGYVPEEGIRSAMKHGTLAIGQLGMAETLQILIGMNHTHPEGLALAKRIEELFSKRCNEFKHEYKLNFGVYYTPAENLCFTAMKKFKERYGVIKNVSDRDYFTNSIHVPVWEQMTPFEKIDIESQLTGYSSAGCITYVELPSTTKNNIAALEEIIDYAMAHDIPYFAINVPNDTCLDCGYTDEINDACPVCGSENIRRLRRVTGYLTTDYHNFNHGKQCEVGDRVKHIKEYRCCCD
ncbi:MAG: anaerobic ribonucleoside-triphosphate reductase [Prevotellaceae bacterium]|nr:anaerobic ribonucleoside-triphosphate reductase [Prevotellaceae bacterium]